MPDITTEYGVKFINYHEDFDEPLEINFMTVNPKDVQNIIGALAGFYSGDPCECFINGEQAVLENDWGLLSPENITTREQT